MIFTHLLTFTLLISKSQVKTAINDKWHIAGLLKLQIAPKNHTQNTIKYGVPEISIAERSLWYTHIDAMTNKNPKQKINYNEKRERN